MAIFIFFFWLEMPQWAILQLQYIIPLLTEFFLIQLKTNRQKCFPVLAEEQREIRPSSSYTLPSSASFLLKKLFFRGIVSRDLDCFCWSTLSRTLSAKTASVVKIILFKKWKCFNELFKKSENPAQLKEKFKINFPFLKKGK